MKPEPLAKEIEEAISLSIESFRDDIKSGCAYVENYDDIFNELKKVLPQQISAIIRQRINQLLKEIEERAEKWKEEERKTLKSLEKNKVLEDFVAIGMDGFYLQAVRLILSEIFDIRGLIKKYLER